MDKVYCVYILTNLHNTVLYTGVTSNLPKRIYEHKNHVVSGFSDKYNTEKLVYYEVFEDVNVAISREKQIKNYRRVKKEKLILSMNPKYLDLYNEII